MSPLDKAFALSLLALALLSLPVWFVMASREARRLRRKRPEPLVHPQPSPPSRPRCSVATCDQRAPWVIKGWPLCTDHAAPILDSRLAS